MYFAIKSMHDWTSGRKDKITGTIVNPLYKFLLRSTFNNVLLCKFVGRGGGGVGSHFLLRGRTCGPLGPHQDIHHIIQSLRPGGTNFLPTFPHCISATHTLTSSHTFFANLFPTWSHFCVYRSRTYYTVWYVLVKKVTRYSLDGPRNQMLAVQRIQIRMSTRDLQDTEVFTFPPSFIHGKS
jgi:hypothetical protein